jgi:hypothetical protein
VTGLLVSFLVVAGAWLPGSATAVSKAETGPLTVAAGHRWPPRKPVAAVGGCPGPVVAAIDRSFGSAAPWAVSIAWRESRCQPGARNRSGASGIFQIELPLHADLFTAVGCSPRSWMDVSCNVAAAFRLYQLAGRSPWRL